MTHSLTPAAQSTATLLVNATRDGRDVTMFVRMALIAQATEARTGNAECTVTRYTFPDGSAAEVHEDASGDAPIGRAYVV